MCAGKRGGTHPLRAAWSEHVTGPLRGSARPLTQLPSETGEPSEVRASDATASDIVRTEKLCPGQSRRRALGFPARRRCPLLRRRARLRAKMGITSAQHLAAPPREGQDQLRQADPQGLRAVGPLTPYDGLPARRRGLEEPVPAPAASSPGAPRLRRSRETHAPRAVGGRSVQTRISACIRFIDFLRDCWHSSI